MRAGHRPLTRQNTIYAREVVELDVSWWKRSRRMSSPPPHIHADNTINGLVPEARLSDAGGEARRRDLHPHRSPQAQRHRPPHYRNRLGVCCGYCNLAHRITCLLILQLFTVFVPCAQGERHGEICRFLASAPHFAIAKIQHMVIRKEKCQ
jgi:hypothetical protein